MSNHLRTGVIVPSISASARLWDLLKLQLLTATLSCVTSCGGGGSGSGGNLAGPPLPQPPDVTSETTVPFVWQTRWYASLDASHASVTVDGVASTIDRIRVSDSVLAKGTFTRRHFFDGHNEDTLFRATSIVDNATVVGPVDSVDLQHRRLVVLNQPISFFAIDTTDCATCDADAGLPATKVGDFVRVSGFDSTDGPILANRIDPAPSSDQVRVRGTVQSLDSGSQRFQINGLVIDYGTASLSGPSGALREGLRVEVVGTLQTSPRGLVAMQINDLVRPFDSGDAVILEGLVDAVAPANEIDVAGYQVTDADCEPAVHAVMRVEGTAVNGRSVAASYCSISTGGLVLTGPIDAIDQVNGTLVVLGIAVQTNFATPIRDNDNTAVTMNVTLGDLEVGDFVDAEGFAVPRSPTDGVVGTDISRVPFGGTSIWGSPTGLAGSDIIIFGRAIHTRADTVFKISSCEGGFDDLTADDYFQQQGTAFQQINVQREADDSLSALEVYVFAYGIFDYC